MEPETGKCSAYILFPQHVQSIPTFYVNQGDKAHNNVKRPVHHITWLRIKIIPVFRGKLFSHITLIIHVTIRHHLHVQLKQHFLINRSKFQPIRETNYRDPKLIC